MIGTQTSRLIQSIEDSLARKAEQQETDEREAREACRSRFEARLKEKLADLWEEIAPRLKMLGSSTATGTAIFTFPEISDSCAIQVDYIDPSGLRIKDGQDLSEHGPVRFANEIRKKRDAAVETALYWLQNNAHSQHTSEQITNTVERIAALRPDRREEAESAAQAWRNRAEELRRFNAEKQARIDQFAADFREAYTAYREIDLRNRAAIAALIARFTEPTTAYRITYAIVAPGEYGAELETRTAYSASEYQDENGYWTVADLSGHVARLRIQNIVTVEQIESHDWKAGGIIVKIPYNRGSIVFTVSPAIYEEARAEVDRALAETLQIDPLPELPVPPNDAQVRYECEQAASAIREEISK